MSVYFITAREVGRVKIGLAYDPWDRIVKLRTGSPVELALEAYTVGDRNTERQLHARFARARLHGEWFTITPEIEAEMQRAEHRPTHQIGWSRVAA